jgi:DNA-binding CsgD family transcriptional regulator
VRGLVADALRAAAEHDVDLALDLLLGAGFRTWWHDPGAPVREEVLTAAESLDVAPDDPRLVAVLAVAGPVSRGATVVERLARHASGPLDGRAAHPLGLAAHCVGASELAVALLSAAAAPLRAQGRLGLLAQVLVMHAWSAVQLGEWTGIGSVADEAARLSRETAQPLWHAGARAAQAALAGVGGDTEAARRIAVEAERAALPSRSSNLLTCIQVARGLTALSAGQHEAAFHHLLRVFDPDDGAHHYAERHGALGYLVEAAVHCGQHERARALVAELEPVARLTPASLLQTGLLYARPVLAPDTEAERLFTAALATDLGHRPFLRARLQLAFGVWLRRARRITESRAPLRAARDTFDALGATPWGERARRELRASGEVSGHRPPAPRDALTPQELQIARLAAAGASNREIGAQLFVSPRTVAAHLYRAFPKLGITSRAQLSAALSATRAAPD